MPTCWEPYGYDSIVLLVIFWKLKTTEIDDKEFKSELNQTSSKQYTYCMIFLFKKSAFPFEYLLSATNINVSKTFDFRHRQV